MLDLSLFRRPAMIGVSVAAFTLSSSIFALFLYLTLYIQDDLGYGPLAAGLRFLPLTLLAFLVAPFAGQLTVRVQARYLLGVGLLLVAAGCLFMATIHADLAVDGRSCPASCSPARASAWSTRCWPRRPSRWCRPSAAAWPRGPTPRSARSASPPASPGWARCSRARSSTRPRHAAELDRGRTAGGGPAAGPQLRPALTAGQVQRGGGRPSPGRPGQALLHAYRSASPAPSTS